MPAFRHLVPFPFHLVALAAIAGEIAWYLAVRRRAYPWRETAVSLAIVAMRIPAKLLHAGAVAPIAIFAWSHRIATVPLGTWWGVVLLFLGEELAYYWSHRLDHRVRWMWATHAVHHTPREIHLASAFRLGLTGVVSGGWLCYVPLYVLGFHPLAVTGMLALNLSYQFWLHTEIVGRLGPVEWIFNTPAHHRVHHACNAEYLDRNYGGMVIIWDRLFGTFAAQRPQTALVYGLAHAASSDNPLTVAFREWGLMARDVLRARGWRQRIGQLFGPPGDSLSGAAPRVEVPDAAR